MFERLRHRVRVASLGLACVLLGASPGNAQDRPRIRIVTDDFVLPGKLHKLSSLASRNGATLDHVFVETISGDPRERLEGADFLILDTPRPMDVTRVHEQVGSALAASTTPWIRVGGGPPAFGNLPPLHARRLSAYYAGGGEANLKAMFSYLTALHAGQNPSGIPAPVALPANGIYHPAAAAPFENIDAYHEWGRGRWKPEAPRVAIIIHSGLFSGFETSVIDAMIARSEAEGLEPIALWFDAGAPNALQDMLGSSKADVIVIATHLQNGPARSAEFAKLNVPVLQTLSYRDGDPASWAAATSGISQRLVAPFLVLPESWGASDPMVVDAVRGGEPVPLPGQIEALMAKVRKLAALRRIPPFEKRLGLMFWNYPPGEKNLSASNLNVPRSLERLASALAEAGYDTPRLDEGRFIEIGQALLGGIYHPDTLPKLHAAGYAGAFPVSRYRAWLDALPAPRREELIKRWGNPDDAPSVFTIDGEKQFLVPRFMAGKLALMPQPQRGQSGASYHDTKEPPSHAYLAAYLLLADTQCDALLHFGTHGTQEWTPGKDRGLSVTDYPYLALGDLPVFYPYIQDNIAEAVQAKRRGRAVTVSHQTPPFAPAGLYDELRDLHVKIHEYVQLDDGAVRDQTAAQIREIVLKSSLHRDMNWDAARMEAAFPQFMTELHDHVHDLARHAMPLGLHTFGEGPSPEHRISTIMQQLGEPFYRLLGAEPDEFFATDYQALQASPPYRLLKERFTAGAGAKDHDSAELATMLERAHALDRHLAETGEVEALLAGLSGALIAPGQGGDPIRNPDVPSGRNIYPFEPDKIPTRAAHEAGGTALQQLIDAYRADHGGKAPQKLAFSLWGSETMRHLGIQEGQILHALGLTPVWNEGGRVTRLDIIPREQLGRPRIDTVVQVTSVYRDQFDGFMRMLAEAIERLAALDEPDSAIVRNTDALARKLAGQGQNPAHSQSLAALRIFSNATGDYGTSLPGSVLKSTSWDSDAPLAEAYLDRLQYAYGSKDWGARIDGANLFAEQLRGVQAAILSRSSKLHGILSTDHPFEYLGGLSLAIRHLEDKAPALYIADLRDQASRVTSVARFLSDEMRSRTLNPHWIGGMQKEGYAGTLELLNAVNNLFGWQVTDPSTVRADQWQSVHETFIRDKHELGLAAWFTQNNPTAEGQIIERMIEAVRKGYWNASEQTRRELAERWHELASAANSHVSEPATRAFIEEISMGFDLPKAAALQAPARPQPEPETAAAPAPTGGEQVRGAVMKPVDVRDAGGWTNWLPWIGLSLLLACFLAGAAAQFRSGLKLNMERPTA